MSEPEVLAANGEVGPTGAAQSAEASAEQAGFLLRQAREAAGVHLEALAVTLKVQVHTLESLEAGRLSELLDVVFARGLASSICRVLKVDAAPVLALLPRKTPAAMAVTPPAVQATFRPADVGGTGPSALRRLLSNPAGLIVLLLVIGAAALWLVPQLQGEDAEVSATASEPAPSNTLEVTPAAAASAAGVAEPPAAVSVPALLPPPAAVAPIPAASAALAPSAAASAAVAGAAAPAVPAGGEMLTISAKAPAWVRVTDAAGVVAINRTLQAGETVHAAGAAPLAVVVGAADAVQVQVRGQAFDLAPIARTNVARFEVK
ncbi:helix-turn-helix domain-containing protein [Variovorax sp. HJSM1_2]|uniref:helix-turn-helix domain-containing protein n=1 Tax=Variovorax sp. HJSM1_2 TaxID=3366263 RepID=UPI003BCEF52B